MAVAHSTRMKRFLGVIAVFGLVATAAAEPAQPTTKCARLTVTGHKGGERQLTCVIDVPIIVKVKPPTPAIVMVPGDGRKVVGRPELADPFKGLPQHLR